MPRESGRRAVIVRKNYDDKSYRSFLHDSFRIEYKSDGRGRTPYYLNVIQKILDENISDIRIDTGEPFHYPDLHRDFRNISEYVRDHSLVRDPDDFLRMIDAFLQLKVPGFNDAYQKRQDADDTGMAMGAFLRDPTSVKDRYQLARNKQAVVGTFEYQDIDTFQEYRGAKRIVTFLGGNDRIDYLLMLDFDFEAALSKNFRRNEYLNLVYGFCIPGEEFSPVVMRTLRHHKRHLGLLYAPGNLIDMAGGVFDELTYEIFTTDKGQQGSKIHADDYSLDFAKALEIHYGPKLRKHLTKVTDKGVLEQLSERISYIEMELL